MPTRPMAKYTGKYKDLVPAGYKFQKLYASNHRSYRFQTSINDSMWIWQKGNDIEILDFYSKSGWIIKCIIKNRDRMQELAEDTLLPNNTCFSIVMNTKTGKIRHYSIAETRHRYRAERRLYERADKKYGPKALDDYFNKYKKAHIPMEMVEEVLRLYDAGLISFEDMEFPEK